MKLEEIRNKIDDVDNKIVELYSQRMELSKDVIEAKKLEGIATENTQREKSIINRVTSKVGDDIKLYTKQVFKVLFDTSKSYQNSFIDVSSKLTNEINKAIEDGIKPFPLNATVACQGINGAYSSIATDKMFELSNIMFFRDFDGVFGAVEKGLCEYGVLPIDNSSVGSVNLVYDLMRKHKFYIVRSIKLRVQHCLLAKKSVDVNDIKEIYSHEQAINQCSEFIKSLGNVKITICDNTAVAAKMVSESNRTDIACISSKECIGIYGLSLVRHNIQDNDSNYTRFIAISKKMQIFEDANKISIVANLPHEAGSLNKILNRFAIQNLNLTKLESRPIANSTFEYAFYFDFDGKIESRVVQNLLADLDNSTDQFIFLGSYQEVI
jgi:chorismate mutase/prephenate dehydratase